uniref:Uncharacterized protein n=1 Tax=Populus alba TaxID=43335 RepID=A0A4V6AAE0_POPAL|nr:hypothetical protein D5086_0000109840 [Populus alba]
MKTPYFFSSLAGQKGGGDCPLTADPNSPVAGLHRFSPSSPLPSLAAFLLPCSPDTRTSHSCRIFPLPHRISQEQRLLLLRSHQQQPVNEQGPSQRRRAPPPPSAASPSSPICSFPSPTEETKRRPTAAASTDAVTFLSLQHSFHRQPPDQKKTENSTARSEEDRDQMKKERTDADAVKKKDNRK